MWRCEIQDKYLSVIGLNNWIKKVILKLLEITVDFAAQYCKNLQYNTTFLHYSKIQ